MKKTKKRITALFIGAILVASMVIGMAGTALAEDKPTLEGTINYDKIKTLTLDSTYYDVCKILFENNTAKYSKGVDINEHDGEKAEDFLAEFLNKDFVELECVLGPTIEFYLSEWEDILAYKDNPEEGYEDAWEFLNRKVDKDTIIKFGYLAEFKGEMNPVQEGKIITYINGKEVEHLVVVGTNGSDAWEEALGTDKAVGLEVYNKIEVYEGLELLPHTYAYFNVGKIEDVLSPAKETETETKTDNPQTADSNDIMSWFAFLGIAVLAGAGTVIYKKAKKNN